MAKFVIDVSQHQGLINWTMAKPNIDGAILRCGFGDNVASQDDLQWSRNLAECERLGIPRGVYLYSYATSDAQAQSELQHILRLIKGHEFQLPIYLDCEEGYTAGYAPRACQIICEGIKAAGYTPGVYANTFWWNNYLKGVTAYTRWVAQYNSVCEYQGQYDIWQYSSSGQVPGVPGNVDVNHCYKDFGELTGKESKGEECMIQEIWAVKGEAGQYYYDGSHLHPFATQKEKDLLVAANLRITGVDISKKVHVYTRDELNQLKAVLGRIK